MLRTRDVKFRFGALASTHCHELFDESAIVSAFRVHALTCAPSLFYETFGGA